MKCMLERAQHKNKKIITNKRRKERKTREKIHSEILMITHSSQRQ